MKDDENSSSADETLMDFDFLRKVVVGIGEVSEITGVPQRKIRYWEEKGLIESLADEANTRRYNYINIKKIILIQELMEEGYTLDAAGAKVEKRLQRINAAFNRLK